MYEVKEEQKNFYELLKNNAIDNEECYNFYQYKGDDKNIIKLSRKDVLERSMEVAKELKAKGAKKGDRVIVFSTQTPDNIFSVVGSMLAGTIFTIIPPPIDANKIDRLKSVVNSCNPKYVLCGNVIFSLVSSVLARDEFSNNPIEIVNSEMCTSNEEFVAENYDLDEVLYIQYSSGSTSEPKGVMITYGNLISAINCSPSVSEIHRIFGWVPFFHNLGLLYLLFIPLIVKGVTSAIMSQAAFLEKPSRWIEGLSEFRAQATLAPNTVFAMYPKLVPAKTLKNIDLTNLQFVLNGSEIVSDLAMKRFASEYREFGFELNNFAVGYGLSEVTCGVAAVFNYNSEYNIHLDFDEYKNDKLVEVLPDYENQIEFVTNGAPLKDQTVKIVNPDTFEECEEDEFGEVWVQSPCVAKGYYNNEAVTNETFRAKLKGHEGIFVRTGDKGIIKNSQLYITGRLKELIIVNGNNILPNDIVSKVKEEIQELRETSIFPFSIMNDNKEKLVLVIGVGQLLNEEIVDRINSCVLKYFEITPYDVRFISLSSVPHTDTGKVSINLVKKGYLNNTFKYLNKGNSKDKSIEYDNHIQRYLGEMIKEEFKVNSSKDDNLLNLGMDSLEVVQMTTNIENEYKVSVPVSFIFENPYIADIAEYIQKSLSGEDLGSLEKDKNFLYDEVKLDDAIKFDKYESEKPEMKKVFLTGTTGFLGAYLLKNLFDRTEAEVYCHVRAKSKEDGLKRIEENMKFYKLWDYKYENRIKPILGTLDEENLGIDKEEYEFLANNIDTIYHNGAILNFIYPYSRLKQTNVLGTIETLKLASNGKSKYYNYISSYSVFDNPSHFNDIAYEDDKLNSCLGYNLSYSESKWVSENIINVAKERGLRAAIYRPGEITGTKETAIWKLSDSVSRTIKAIMTTGEYPDMDMYIHMTQIDYISAAIIHISKDINNYGKAFNLLNSKPVPIKRLGEIINDSGYEAHLVDFEQWKQKLFNADNNHPLKLLESLFKVSKKTIEENINFRYGKISPKYDTTNTDKALIGTDIECEPMNEEIVKKYIRNFA